ncbi:MAG: type II secretion system protein N, partial [Pseudomonadota bacterium]
KIWREIAPRAAIVLLATGSLAYAAPPVLRHLAGIVVIEAAAPLTALDIPDETPTDLAPLFQKAPFGQVAQPEKNGPDPGTEVPNMVLRGVFVSTGSRSAALLDVDGRTALFREAESVTPVFVLSQVAADHVTLTGQSKSLTLHFDDGALLTKSPDTDASTATSREGLIARLGGGIVVPARYQKPKSPETTSEYIDYWRNRIRKNPQTVLDEIGLTATDQGYVIADEHDVGVKLAGLKSGDLVRSVNGQAVGDPLEDRRFYDQIAASGQARIEVERGGRLLTFSFPLR